MENLTREFSIVLDINFTVLKEQKAEILKVISETKSKERLENLSGILHLIDAIQDHAVEELGIDENLIFDLINLEDER
jgi:hypothetical protein